MNGQANTINVCHICWHYLFAHDENGICYTAECVLCKPSLPQADGYSVSHNEIER